jgi:pyrophosphatase PpaX
VISSDNVTRPKPDPDGVLLAGESPGDVQAGRAANARTSAVLWAAYRPGRLREIGADFICETVDDLRAAIDRLDADR